VEYDGVFSALKLYVNDAQVGVATGQLAPPPHNYLNGIATVGLYYKFRYYWGALSLNDMQGTLCDIGATCSEAVNACLPDGRSLCNSSDTYHFEICCAACTMTDYGRRDSRSMKQSRAVLRALLTLMARVCTQLKVTSVLCSVGLV
jgi:hypothetical protein